MLMATRSKSFIPGVAVAFIFLVLGLTVGAVFYHIVEGLAPVDAVYFAAMTMTTVGYGDFVPMTDVGKIFTAIYAFVGIGVFLGFAALFFQSAVGRVQELHKGFKSKRRPR